MNTMGILGPRGTHSEEAAMKLNGILPEPVKIEIFSEIFEVLNAVEDGRVDSGFVPVENSLEGAINITLDTLAGSDKMIVVREVIVPIKNYLMTKPETNLTGIKRIYSHAQPISQCRNYLRANFSGAELCAVQSTARAAEIVSESGQDEGAAAICTESAGKICGLVTRAEEIQDNPANCTRFFEVRRKDEVLQTDNAGDKVLIVCRIDGSRPGALCEVLEEFSSRKVNMTRIESRPARTQLGEYIFFFDLEISDNIFSVKDSVASVRKKSIMLKNLGTFPVIRFDV